MRVHARKCPGAWIARALLLALVATPLHGRAGDPRQCVLENAALRLTITLDAERIAARTFENRITGERFNLPAEVFRLEFADGSMVSAGGLTARVESSTADRITLLLADAAGLEARVQWQLPPQAAYVRKQIALRQTAGPPRQLLRVELETWQGAPGGWRTLRPDRHPYGSHPVFCESIWAGVEFVVAFNRVAPDGFTLGSRPGRPAIGPQWYALRNTTIGVAPRGGVRDAFLRYIDDIRLSPPQICACYNSWWTLPKVVRQQDNLALIGELKAALYDRQGVFFDIITTDMGWSHPRSVWEIDRSTLPRGFDDIRAIVEPAGGKLGLWMSPSEIYPPVCDYDWAEKAGYTVLWPQRANQPGQPTVCTVPGMSLADPKYRAEAKQQLQRLIRENGLAHIKYDGFWALEQHSHHGLAPGEDSVEPLAEYSLELLAASKAANPRLVTEPTYMNSIFNYISPWIIKYSDTVWANGEDCVVGIGPAPDYRESHTNAREHMVFQSLDQVWLPQNALHYFDIIHVDQREGFANHAAMAFARGRFFLSTYVNPKLMDADDWRIYAGLLRWARQNADVLRQTTILSSRVERGEPYGYAHWRGQRGIIAVRNPSNANQRFELDLARAGAPANLSDAVCYTQYPGRRGLAGGLHGGSHVSLELGPWELLFLEVVPRLQLQETVALGARWYRAAGGRMKVVPDKGVKTVVLVAPGGDRRSVVVKPRVCDAVRGEVYSRAARRLPEAQWLAAKPKTLPLFPFNYPAELSAETLTELRQTREKSVAGKNVPSVAFDVECAVSIPPQAKTGQILLLVEFPGRAQYPSHCQAQADGRPLDLVERASAEHIGYYNWTGTLRAVESEWCWYIGTLEPGTHRVKFAGQAGHLQPRLGLWAWADQELRDQQPAGTTCSEPGMPQYRDHLERQGVCLLKPEEVIPLDSAQSP